MSKRFAARPAISSTPADESTSTFSAASVNALGHCHPALVEALTRQAGEQHAPAA
jgi:acetylornithine/succinyldiaminopimelate/putrescine aminotransferase